MTCADNIRTQLWYIRKQQPERLINVVEEFYERLNNVEWKVEGIRSSGTWGFQGLEIRFADGRREVISYEAGRNRWSVSGWGQSGSDASVAEFLGVPVAYLCGFTDAFTSTERLTDRVRNYEDWMKKVRALYDKEYERYRQDTFREAAERVAEAQAGLIERVTIKDDYPDVPPPMRLVAERKQTTLPSESGIYFLWNGGRVQYVGQSVNLRNRCIASHQQAMPGDWCSWVLIDSHELNFAECYYIGVLRPARNFTTGKRPSKGGPR